MLSYLLVGILTFAYAGFMCKVLGGWSRLKTLLDGVGSALPISVVIACRNESTNIHALLKSLEKQRYDRAFYEVILVDDDSTDETDKIIEQLQSVLPVNFSLYRLEKHSGKKAALSFGINMASHEHIVTTDADCLLPTHWLKSYAEWFTASKADFIAGPVQLSDGSGFFEKMQKFEFETLAGITAAFFGAGNPIMCNGANLGFTKRLFNELGGYSSHEQIASGDDVFLMQEAKAKGYRLQYLYDRSAIVFTGPQSSFSDFVKQRIRWAGKSSSYKDRKALSVALLILSYNVALLILLALVFYDQIFWLPFSFLFGTKFLLDSYFLFQIKRFFQLKNILLNSFMLSLLYPFYAVGIGLTSLFIPVKWKENNVENLKEIG